MNGRTRLTVFAALATTLATIGLTPTFRQGSWFWAAIGAIVVVAGVAELSRRISVPRPLVPVVAALGLLCYLVFAYARSKATLGVLPDLDALLLLGDVAASGFEDINRFAAPVRPYEGIVAITAAGVGLVAIVVDTIAVTYRRAALAGLPLLALYSVPSAVVQDGAHWLVFVLGAVGYLALLLADNRERITRWGRPLGFSAADRHTGDQWRGEVETAPLAVVGRRIGAAALGVAVIAPALVPGLDEGIFGRGGFGDGDGGTRMVAAINPLVSIKRDLERPDNREVIRMRTQDDTPDYLRLATLDTFDGTTWRPPRLDGPREQQVSDGIPDPPGLDPAVRRSVSRYEISIGQLQDIRLPLPYPPQQVIVDGDWRYDAATRNVFSLNEDTRDLDYEVLAYEVTPTPDQLRAAPPAEPGSSYTDLPADLPSVVRETARRVTKDSPTAYDQAIALQRFFREDFTYDLKVRSGNSARLIEDFLKERRGYCEQFAATMAIMTRALGIPSRVNTGFTPGTQLDDGSWSIGLHNAHAWPELYFEGIGWVRFEPTPRGEGNVQAPPWTTPVERDPGLNGPGGGSPRSLEGGASSGLDPRSERLGGDEGGRLPGAQETAPAADAGFPWQPVLLGGLAVVLLALLPMAVRALQRQRRWRAGPHLARRANAAWAELRDTAIDFGYGWSEAHTPRQAADRLAHEARLELAEKEALARLARMTERVRYARSTGAAGDLRADVGTVRVGFARDCGRLRRWRARLLPASTAALLPLLGERIADGLDWVDRFGAQLRRRITAVLPHPRRA